MADAALAFLLLLSLAATLTLALLALRYWRAERVGLVYELPVDLRGTALRAAAAGLAALVATALAVPLLHTAPPSRAAEAAPASTAPRLPLAAPAPPLPQPAPTPPPVPSRTPEPPPPLPEPRTLGHPSGGTLQILGDRTRVWLPPGYDSPRGADFAYPVVLAHLDTSDSALTTDLFGGFAVAAQRGRSDSFLLVMPDSCARPPAVILSEVSRRYRVLTARTARGVLGIGAQASCAVREALADPDRYHAVAGISGTYPPIARPPGPHPPLLLAAAAGESGSRDSARRLRLTLRPRADDVRLLDGTARRPALIQLVAAYLTEKLDGPARRLRPTARKPAAPAHPPTSPHPSAPAHLSTSSHPSASRPLTTSPHPSTSSNGSAPARPTTPSLPPAPARPSAPPRPSGTPHPSKPSHRSTPPPSFTPSTPSASRLSLPSRPPAPDRRT
ncbi:hypothetical protein [Actinacidiphila sp. ITFR-21]|uniref:hypothetical protein n=1 Tax=Actinacidiphila sp. ITFR-21 TaxID=3075199 RepID=UPI00288AB148|nr:hypothetical protein [Streptomyces sp. ITFR-21]WNI16237.1 hypothetical protein RLT57_12315 [Streptomyces sp. ITFR-21]